MAFSSKVYAFSRAIFLDASLDHHCIFKLATLSIVSFHIPSSSRCDTHDDYLVFSLILFEVRPQSSLSLQVNSVRPSTLDLQPFHDRILTSTMAAQIPVFVADARGPNFLANKPQLLEAAFRLARALPAHIRERNQGLLRRGLRRWNWTEIR